MRAVFGVVSLLIVLAVVGVSLSRQLKSVGAVSAGGAPKASANVSVGEQSQRIQQQVVRDVSQALEQGAARKSSADE